MKIIFLLSWIVASFTAIAQQQTVTIGLIGDSTVANTYGWGPAFSNRVNERTTVLNYAKNGATLDSLSEALEDLIKERPEYVLIQFGHNDMKEYGVKTYSNKLRIYVQKIARAGGRAIVLSSVTRRNFDKQGKISPIIIRGRTLPDFARSAKAVAKKENVAFIDLNTLSIDLHNRIGPKASAAFDYSVTDTTHFSNQGAEATADLIITGLAATVPELTPYLVMGDKNPTVSNPPGTSQESSHP